MEAHKITELSVDEKIVKNVQDKIALVMMVRNEEKRITVSFDSVSKFVKTFIILDTGSTDQTIPIMQKYCQDHDITLHLKEEAFVDYEISRNCLLDFCDEVVKEKIYLLLLDCNDELRNPDALVTFVNTYKGESTGFYLQQKWFTGRSLDSYLNVRVVISHSQWRFVMPVHEYITSPCVNKNPNLPSGKIEKIEGLILYQDRTLDDDKSLKRFPRDKKLLYNRYLKDPTEPRILFYLGQTCACLGQYDEAYRYYILRIRQIGFSEEIYHSLYRLGEVSETLKHSWEESLNWYLRAFQHMQRVEPLYKIAQHYYKLEMWPSAYMYASMATQLVYPVNQILFVNSRMYTYERWTLLANIAYKCGKYREGKDACIHAIEAENFNHDLDLFKLFIKKELEFINGGTLANNNLLAMTYLDKEVRTKPELTTQVNRSVFIPPLTTAAQNEYIQEKIAIGYKGVFNLVSGDQRNTVLGGSNKEVVDQPVTREQMKQKLNAKKKSLRK